MHRSRQGSRTRRARFNVTFYYAATIVLAAAVLALLVVAPFALQARALLLAHLGAWWFGWTKITTPFDVVSGIGSTPNGDVWGVGIDTSITMAPDDPDTLGPAVLWSANGNGGFAPNGNFQYLFAWLRDLMWVLLKFFFRHINSSVTQ